MTGVVSGEQFKPIVENLEFHRLKNFPSEKQEWTRPVRLPIGVLLLVEILHEAVSGTINRRFHHFHCGLRWLRVEFCQWQLGIGLKGEAPTMRILVEHGLKKIEGENVVPLAVLSYQNIISFQIGPSFNRFRHNLSDDVRETSMQWTITRQRHSHHRQKICQDEQVPYSSWSTKTILVAPLCKLLCFYREPMFPSTAI